MTLKAAFTMRYFRAAPGSNCHPDETEPHRLRDGCLFAVRGVSRSPAEPSPSEAVGSVIERFSQALSPGDFATLRALTAPTFRLIEDGVEYDLPGVEAALREV